MIEGTETGRVIQITLNEGDAMLVVGALLFTHDMVIYEPVAAAKTLTRVRRMIRAEPERYLALLKQLRTLTHAAWPT